MLDSSMTTLEGAPGWRCTFYNHDAEGKWGAVVLDSVIKNTVAKFSDFVPDGLTPTWSIRMKGLLTIDKTCPFELGLCVAGAYSQICLSIVKLIVLLLQAAPSYGPTGSC